MKRLLVLLGCVFGFPQTDVSHAQSRWVGPENRQVLTFASEGPSFFAGTDSGIYRSTDLGMSWTVVDSMLVGFPFEPILIDGQTIYAATTAVVYRSTDRGVTWTRLFDPFNSVEYISALVKVGNDLIAGSSVAGTYSSTDSGATWKPALQGQTNTEIQSLALLGSNLFASARGKIYRSIDTARSWVSVTPSVPLDNVPTLAAIGTTLFAGSMGEGAFRSTDSGDSWVAIDTGLQNLYVIKLLVDGTNLLAGTDDGIFLSSDLGAHWNQIVLPGHRVLNLAINGPNLCASDDSTGIFLIPLSTLSVRDENIPESLSLEIYPNPSSSLTQIRYTLGERHIVNISIRDALGRTVAHPLMSQWEDAGSHTMQFDADGLPAGVYYCQLLFDGVLSSIPVVVR